MSFSFKIAPFAIVGFREMGVWGGGGLRGGGRCKYILVGVIFLWNNKRGETPQGRYGRGGGGGAVARSSGLP